MDVDEGDDSAELGAGEAVAEDPWARHEARVGAAQGRFGATAMIGRPYEKARACCLQQGFPAVLREEQGGGSVRGGGPRESVWSSMTAASCWRPACI